MSPLAVYVTEIKLIMMKTYLIEKQLGKRFFSVLSMLAFAVLSWADNITVSMDDFSIAPGETYTVAINVTSDVECGSAFQGIIELPAGLTIVADEEGEYIQKNSDRCSRKFILGSSTSAENKDLLPNQVKFSLYSSNGDNMTNTSGAVLYFSVSASDELAEDSQIKLIEGLIKGNNASSEEPSLPVSCSANVHNSTYVAAIMKLTAQPFSLTPTKEYDLTFSFEKNRDVTAFQADITLPEGMTFVKNSEGEYVAFNEARITANHIYDTNLLNDNKTLRVFLYHSKNLPMKLDEGEFFTVKVKGNTALDESSEIKVTNMEFVQNSTTTFNPEDFTVSVSNPDIPATSEAGEKINEVKKQLEDVKTNVASLPESLKGKFAAEIDAISSKIEEIEETLGQDYMNGDVAANAETRNAAIADVANKVVAVATAIEEAKKAYTTNEEQHTADLAAIAEVKVALEAAKAKVAEYAESVQAAVAEDIKAVEEAIIALEAQAQASYAAGTAIADAEKLAEAIAVVNAQITAVAEKAEEAQVAYTANEEQYVADIMAIEEVKAALEEAKAEIMTLSEKAQQTVAGDIKDTEEAVSLLEKTAMTSYISGTSVADAEELAEAVALVKAQIVEILEKAKSVTEVDTENEAQHVADINAILTVQNKFEAAKATIKGYDERVQDKVSEEIFVIDLYLQEAYATAQKSYDNGTAVKDAESLRAFLAAIESLITTLEEKAAYENEQITTGIVGITEGGSAKKDIYDLSGRCVKNAKGIIIVNGKKYINR